MATKPERFDQVEFKKYYPGNRVADHEIFMAFNGDDQATAFYEWWHKIGCTQFAKWLNRLDARTG